jgi:hypothetical protein
MVAGSGRGRREISTSPGHRPTESLWPPGAETPNCFPPPWSISERPESFAIEDANGTPGFEPNDHEAARSTSNLFEVTTNFMAPTPEIA